VEAFPAKALFYYHWLPEVLLFLFDFKWTYHHGSFLSTLPAYCSAACFLQATLTTPVLFILSPARKLGALG